MRTFVTSFVIAISLLITACGGAQNKNSSAISAEEYEKQFFKVEAAALSLSIESQKLEKMSDKTIMAASENNFSAMMYPVLESTVDSFSYLSGMVVKANDDKVSDLEGKIKALYSQASHLPRVISVKISSFPPSGIATMKVGQDIFRVVLGPGLLESSVSPSKDGKTVTSYQPRELIAVMKDNHYGGYRIATGIIFLGQTDIEMTWDPRFFLEIDGFLDYHNVTDQKSRKWLKFD